MRPCEHRQPPRTLHPCRGRRALLPQRPGVTRRIEPGSSRRSRRLCVFAVPYSTHPPCRLTYPKSAAPMKVPSSSLLSCPGYVDGVSNTHSLRVPTRLLPGTPKRTTVFPLLISASMRELREIAPVTIDSDHATRSDLSGLVGSAHCRTTRVTPALERGLLPLDCCGLRWP